ncbi:hypothetical protein J7E96_29345 [Streptomyces sp. ISL-96]|uniref:hypothetical protein n=1 Tax=Streptomyces sp. ISL-96 TaxID=2819191 RepID=UPI001BE51A9A|nr:hypothetical protein [Streptomyces sp. ISL-96]MBT2492541.1 hypothetical protein [Streptomyces sp. ISL-96]
MVLALVAGILGVAAGPSAAAQKSCVTRMKDDFGKVKTYNWCNIKKVKYVGLQTGKNYISIVQGRGPMTLTLTATETVSNTKSSSIDVSAGAVSAAVGFDVTRSRTKSMAGSWVVPKGKFGTLKAYPVYKAYSFKAYSKVDGKYVGKGVARKAIGYRYAHSAR